MEKLAEPVFLGGRHPYSGEYERLVQDSHSHKESGIDGEEFELLGRKENLVKSSPALVAQITCHYEVGNHSSCAGHKV